MTDYARNQILIVGPAGAGKSTAALAFCRAVGLTMAEMGQEVLHHYSCALWQTGRDEFKTLVGTKEYLRTTKTTHRMAWLAFGNALVAQDPLILVRGCMQAQVIVGMRRQSEYVAYRREFPLALDRVILVARPYFEKSSDEFEFDFFSSIARVTLMNDGTESELVQKAKDLALNLVATRMNCGAK